ncbi:hypothetical protein FRC10_006836 [Ceratobasidium sp. 414]|nr:hypothetical protein FRC10_006836 [Ceratobasidium sp. 414]
MERFCGHLLVPALKNRIRPYEHLDNYVQRRAQMQIVSCVNRLPSLARPRIRYTYQAGEKLSSREKMYLDYMVLQVPKLILSTPINKNVQVNVQLTNQLTKYFGVAYNGEFNGQELRKRIDMATLVRYGRFRTADDGDKVRTADLIARDPLARDNSFVRYDLYRTGTPLVEICRMSRSEGHNMAKNDTRKPYLLVRIKECNTGGVDAAQPHSPVVTYTRLSTPDIIHINTIEHVIGRVRIDGRKWAIIDRSRNGARTQFIDDDGNEFD